MSDKFCNHLKDKYVAKKSYVKFKIILILILLYFQQAFVHSLLIISGKAPYLADTQSQSHKDMERKRIIRLFEYVEFQLY